jgi:ribosomal-protein-alanine N-acetyltransferase
MPRMVEPVIPEDAMSKMSKMSQPVIAVDDSLRLRPFTTGDAATVHRAFDDPEIRHWHAFRTDVIGDTVAWTERANELRTLNRSGVWAIADRADEVLGRVALHVHLHDGTAEIAYWVLPDADGWHDMHQHAHLASD